MRSTAVAFILSLIVLVPACGKKPERELSVLQWSEYIDPGILEDFTKETGIAVRVSVYEDSEEMLQKLEYASGGGQYDVIVASNHVVPLLVRKELVRPLDRGQIGTLENIDEAFRTPAYDPEGRYAAPYLWGTTGLLVDRSKVPDLAASWKALFDPAARRGTFLMVNESRDVLGAALILLGHSVNTTNADEVKAAMDLVIEAKGAGGCLGFQGGVEAVDRVASGGADYAMAWNGDAQRAITAAEEETPGRLEFVLPEEGSIIWTDSMLVPANAANPEWAHKYITYILRPEVGARLAQYVEYATPNRAARALLPEEHRDNPVLYPPAEVMEKLHYETDLGEATTLYEDAWTAIKTD